MKRLIGAALALTLSLLAAPAMAACNGYTTNTAGVTANGQLEALTELCSKFDAGVTVVGALATPTSVLTRVSDTNAYAQNDLIGTSVTAGSVVVPSVSVARVAAGSAMIRRVRLYTNKASGWDGVPLRVRFWSAAPTYANGDNGAYSVSTGAAGYLGKVDVTLEQFGDGAAGIGVPYIGAELGLKLASGQVIYWDLQYTGAAALSPASGQTFTVVPETQQN